VDVLHLCREAGLVKLGHMALDEKAMAKTRTVECWDLLEEFTHQVAEFNEQTRSIRYLCPPGRRDDLLHATNLCVDAFLLAYCGG